jgi:hypothetical protein
MIKLSRRIPIILPVVLYWCEIWSLTLRNENRLGVFERKVLRRIFGGGTFHEVCYYRQAMREKISSR